MRTVVTVSIESNIGVLWPEGVPLPSSGDTVLLRHNAETLAFVVESRFFSIGIDPTGEPLATVQIRGTATPVPSVL